MRCYSISALVAVLLLGSVSAIAQEHTVLRIGVSLVSIDERKGWEAASGDRLLKGLNHEALDGGPKATVQAVALDGQGSKALAEAKDKNCEFVLFVRITGIRSYEESEISTLGGPLQVLHKNVAVVEYDLRQVKDGTEYALGSVESQGMYSASDAVEQAMRRVAKAAVADLKNWDAGTRRAEGSTFGTGEIRISSEPCSWLPTDIEHAAGLTGACQFAMNLPSTLPNFVCDQQTARYQGQAKVPQDLITAVVRYEDGIDSYSDVKLNGKIAPKAVSESPGIWSSGQFGGNLRAVFDVSNRAQFKFSGEARIGDRAAWIFSYEIARQNTPLWRFHERDEVVAPPYSGEIWVEQKTGGLMRFKSSSQEMPLYFNMRKAELITDYYGVKFADSTSFPLPMKSVVATGYQGGTSSRNVIQFSNCHKFRATARLVAKATFDGDRVGAIGSDPPEDVRRREVEENETIYAILREQAIREDADRLELEHQADSRANTVQLLARMANLDKVFQRYREEQKAKTKTISGENSQQTVIKVRVNLVQVDALIKDPNGRAVGDLEQDDFQLFESGKPLAITKFSRETAMVPKTESRPLSRLSGESTTSDQNPKIPSTSPRFVAYVFDDLYSRFEDLRAAAAAASRQVGRQSEGDNSGIFVTSGQGGIDFTSDQKGLNDALRRLRPHGRNAFQCPRITPYVADLIVNQGDREALRVATEDANRCAYGGDSKLGELAERLARSTAMQVLSEGMSETQSTLGILREVLHRLAAMPGRRSMVLVSPGFITLSPETRQAVMGLIDEALQSYIVVNTLDIRGLTVPIPDANRMHSSLPVVQLRLDREESNAQTEVLADLAYSTGGTYFHNNNSMDDGFQRTAEAPEFIYVLAFVPQKLDGKYHKIKVTLRPSVAASRGKLTVQARQGYYAMRSGIAN